MRHADTRSRSNIHYSDLFRIEREQQLGLGLRRACLGSKRSEIHLDSALRHLISFEMGPGHREGGLWPSLAIANTMDMYVSLDLVSRGMIWIAYFSTIRVINHALPFMRLWRCQCRDDRQLKTIEPFLDLQHDFWLKDCAFWTSILCRYCTLANCVPRKSRRWRSSTCYLLIGYFIGA